MLYLYVFEINYYIFVLCDVRSNMIFVIKLILVKIVYLFYFFLFSWEI